MAGAAAWRAAAVGGAAAPVCGDCGANVAVVLAADARPVGARPSPVSRGAYFCSIVDARLGVRTAVQLAAQLIAEKISNTVRPVSGAPLVWHDDGKEKGCGTRMVAWYRASYAYANCGCALRT